MRDNTIRLALISFIRSDVEKRMKTTNFYCQCAPINEIIKPAIAEEFPKWPSTESQQDLRSALQLDHTYHFLPLHTPHASSSSALTTPIVYRRTLFKMLMKSVEDAGEEVADGWMQDYLGVLEEEQTTFAEARNTGYFSYSSPLVAPLRIPIFVQRGHNEVGMKVWNAGLYLIEAFYCLIQQSIDKLSLDSSSNTVQRLLNFWFSGEGDSNVGKGKVFYELGSGVGMTGIVAQRALFLPLLTTLLCSLDQERPPIESFVFPKFYLTDYSEEIAESIEFNINLSETCNADSAELCAFSTLADRVGIAPSQLDHSKWIHLFPQLLQEQKRQRCLEGRVLNWKNYSSQDFNNSPIHCLFAADCTYSEDLNIAIVDVFEDYISNNILNRRLTPTEIIAETDNDHTLLLPLRLLGRNIPFVLIACTVRNIDTYEHFLSCLNAKLVLQTLAITKSLDIARQKFPYQPPFVYESYCTDIRLLCILHRKIEIQLR